MTFIGAAYLSLWLTHSWNFLIIYHAIPMLANPYPKKHHILLTHFGDSYRSGCSLPWLPPNLAALHASALRRCSCWGSGSVLAQPWGWVPSLILHPRHILASPSLGPPVFSPNPLLKIKCCYLALLSWDSIVPTVIRQPHLIIASTTKNAACR